MSTRRFRFAAAVAVTIGGLATIGGALNCAAPTRTARTIPAHVPKLVVLTYNVNFGIPGDLPTMEAIARADADVIFLQETTAEWETALRATFSHTYPHQSFHHCCGAGGLAVLSRLPFETPTYLPPPEGGWFPAQAVVLQTPLGPVQALNVHLRPPASESGSFASGYFTTPRVRAQEIATYHAALNPKLPTIIVGDFNEDRDGRAVKFLEERGFRSALPEFSPKQHTWRWPTPVLTLRMQLDHIVYDAALEPAAVQVLPLGRSDHLPVLATFEAARGRHEL